MNLVYHLQKGWSRLLLGRKNIRILFNLCGIFLLCVFVISWQSFEMSSLWGKLYELWKHPYTLIVIIVMYGVAFSFVHTLEIISSSSYYNERGFIWIVYSLFINHVSPLKVGDAVRIAIITKESDARRSDTIGCYSSYIRFTYSWCIWSSRNAYIVGNVLLNVPVILACICIGSGALFLLYKKVPQFVEDNGSN